MKKLFLLLLCSFATNLFAQKIDSSTTPKFTNRKVREIGLADFSTIVFRKEIKPNIYRRLNFALVSANLFYVKNPKDNLQNGGNVNFRIGWGKEKREEIHKKFQWMHGFNYSAGLSRAFKTDGINLGFGVGYGIGVQYNINERFYARLETVPSINFDVSFVKDDNFQQSTTQIRTNFINDASPSLQVAWRF